MLSINPIVEKNSLVELAFEDMEIVERREKLIQLAKSRQKKQTQANNLMKAAQAEMKRRASTVILDNPMVSVQETAILEKILKKEESHKQWFKHGLCFIVLVI